MKKIERLALDEYIGIVKGNKVERKVVGWCSKYIEVKQMLSVDEYINVIRRIFADCRTPDSENMVQLELIDFAIKTNIISAYANIELPENLDDLYYIVYGTDLYEKVCANVNEKQVESIISSVKLCVTGS